MSRKLIAVLVSLFAVAFAFGALTAIRWPSIIMVLGFLNEGEAEQAGEALAGIDWRQLGIAYGLPYFLAAISLYVASALIAQRRHGAFAWYVMGCIAGFPSIYLVDFEPGWWRDPSAAEGAIAGAGLIAGLLAMAVWDLRRRAPKTARPDAAAAPARPKRPRGPTPAAIVRQRAMFATHGRKMLERERRRKTPVRFKL